MPSKNKGFAVIPIVIASAILIFIGLILARAGFSLNYLKYTLFANSQTIDCINCYVIRVREASWVGLGDKPEPDKIWEVEAKPGAKTSNGDWTMEVLSADSQSATVQFAGRIYYSRFEDIRKNGYSEITDPVILKTGWFQGQRFGSGTVGGGANWTFTYLKKDWMHFWNLNILGKLSNFYNFHKAPTYTSEELGISFKYPSNAYISEKDNKVFIRQESDDTIEAGQWVEVFEKDPEQSLEEAIKERLLVDYPECKVRVITGNGDVRSNTDSMEFAKLDEGINLEKCPLDYYLSWGITYFSADTKHPTKFVFFKLGQYFISSEAGMWQETLTFRD